MWIYFLYLSCQICLVCLDDGYDGKDRNAGHFSVFIFVSGRVGQNNKLESVQSEMEKKKKKVGRT